MKNLVTAFVSPFNQLWKHRELIWQLTKREVLGRYRGSFLGLFWSFLNPLLMLLVYTFFFGIIYQARWGTHTGSKVEFALTLFAGLIPFTLFSECINRAPSLILANQNYVKKVVFPLDILSWVNLGSALFHAAISILVLLFFYLIINHTLHWTLLLLPLVNLPLILLILGLSWLLSSLGVFIRDIVSTIHLFTLAMLFLSPVFYSITLIPEPYRHLMYLNPLTSIIEQNRAIIIEGNTPDWYQLMISITVTFMIACLGYFWFQKTRSAFADVV